MMVPALKDLPYEEKSEFMMKKMSQNDYKNMLGKIPQYHALWVNSDVILADTTFYFNEI